MFYGTWIFYNYKSFILHSSSCMKEKLQRAPNKKSEHRQCVIFQSTNLTHQLSEVWWVWKLRQDKGYEKTINQQHVVRLPLPSVFSKSSRHMSLHICSTCFCWSPAWIVCHRHTDCHSLLEKTMTLRGSLFCSFLNNV